MEDGMSNDLAQAPRRVVEPVASYRTHPEAETAVGVLADRGFPVAGISIVARELKFVEQVTGRRGYGRAAFDAAAGGAITGALVGFILGAFSAVAPVSTALALALWGLVLGAVVGALVGLLGHGLGSRRRHFSSVSALEAGCYDVMAPSEVAGEARRLLSEPAARRAA